MQLKNGSLVVVPASLIVRLKSHFHSLPYGVDLIIGLNGLIWVSKTVPKALRADGEEIGFGEESGEGVYSSENEVSAPTPHSTRFCHCSPALTVRSGRARTSRRRRASPSRARRSSSHISRTAASRSRPTSSRRPTSPRCISPVQSRPPRCRASPRPPWPRVCWPGWPRPAGWTTTSSAGVRAGLCNVR